MQNMWQKAEKIKRIHRETETLEQEGTGEKDMKGKENKQSSNRPILLTGVQLKSHMISDSAGHVARSWSGLPAGRKSQCAPAQRAFLSLFSFPPSSLFLSFLFYCECLSLRSRPWRISEKELSSFTVLLDGKDSWWKMSLSRDWRDLCRFWHEQPLPPVATFGITGIKLTHTMLKNKKE